MKLNMFKLSFSFCVSKKPGIFFTKTRNFQVPQCLMTSKLRNALADCNRFGMYR